MSHDCHGVQTGWKYPLVDLEPANRMFVHGRAACTCSLYIQGNHSAGPAPKNVNPLGRSGDARFVFGVFKGTTHDPEQPQVGALAMYPLWDAKFGPATPTTYAVVITQAIHQLLVVDRYFLTRDYH